MEEAVIVSVVRTPVGNHGGVLSPLSAVDLGAIVIAEALKRAGIEPREVDEVIMGNVVSAGAGMSPARQAAVAAGLPVEIPAMTINKVCGSGLKAVVLAAQAIKCGDAQVVVAGGTESMSNAPYLLPRARWGYKLGNAELVDSVINDGLYCHMAQCHMGVTAETLAIRYEISREEMDSFSLRSHMRAVKAIDEGRFKGEIVPVSVPQARGQNTSVDKDERPRRDTSSEKLASLKPAFKEGGNVTAGNSPGINDGAAAVVVMSARRAKQKGVKPLAVIRSYASSGVEPLMMGVAPVYASRVALHKSGLNLGDIDLIELNEAFAAQALAVGKELELDWEKTNVNGGAIALGHPLGATGARILTTLLSELKRRQGRYGLATLCIGGGQGIAMLVERTA
jgi:acetyl-CoA C-acetyltransferase